MTSVELLQELQSMNSRLRQPSAVFVGNNRLLVRTLVKDLLYLVPADDLLIVPRFAMFGIFESDVTNFFLKNIGPAHRCLDVGCNFGYYTCLMRSLASEGIVVGVEADPQVARLARDNLCINWMTARAQVLNIAISDSTGTLTLHRRDQRSGNTSIIKLDDVSLDMLNEKPSEAFTVEARSLDEIVLSSLDGKVDFVKIDVEGAEPLVFKGAAATLDRNPDLKIVMEWSPAQIAQAGFSIRDFLAALELLGLVPARLEFDGSASALQWSEVSALEYCNLLLCRRGGVAS